MTGGGNGEPHQKLPYIIRAQEIRSSVACAGEVVRVLS